MRQPAISSVCQCRDGLRFCATPCGAAFGYKAAMAGAGGQEPLLAPGAPFHNQMLPRRHGVLECLSFHRTLDGPSRWFVRSAFRRIGGSFLSLMHPRRRRFSHLAISRTRCRAESRRVGPNSASCFRRSGPPFGFFGAGRGGSTRAARRWACPAARRHSSAAG